MHNRCLTWFRLECFLDILLIPTAPLMQGSLVSSGVKRGPPSRAALPPLPELCSQSPQITDSLRQAWKNWQPLYPKPFSPVTSILKFIAIRGATAD